MNINQLLHDLEQKRVQLWIADGKLRYRGPKQELTPQLLADLKSHSEALLQRLQAAAAMPVSAPLTPGQRALWLHTRLAPHSSAYHLVLLAEIRETLDLARLERALSLLAKRHPILATLYAEQAGAPQQTWQPDLKPHLQRRTLDAQADVFAAAMARADEAFDLATDSPLRLAILDQGAQLYMVLVAHHIALDFHSLEIVIEDLERFYQDPEQSIKAGPPAFFRYVREQEVSLAGARGQQLWSYWRDRLSDLPPMLQLPFDFPRPATSTHQGAAFHFAVAPERSQRLRALARVRNTTPFVLLLACFKAWLYRYTDQRDMLVVTPSGGRDHQDWEGEAGYFANPFVLRTQILDDPSLSTWVSRVRALFLESFDHGSYPFALLIERMQAEFGLRSRHLFQVAFVWDQAQTSACQQAETRLLGRHLASEQRGADYDLTLTFFEQGEHLRGTWKYATDLFRPGTIARASGHFHNLLDAFLDDRDQRLSELDYLDGEERAHLIVSWNQTYAPFPAERDILTLIAETCARYPERPALENLLETRSINYATLWQETERLGSLLRQLGVGPDLPVGICLERGPERVVAILAVLWAGGVFLPLDPEYPESRLALMIQDSAAGLIISCSALRAKLPAGTRMLDLDAGASGPPQTRCAVLPAHGAYCIYTSGSTGLPKGVLITRRNLVNLVTAQNLIYGLGPEDRMLQFASFSFDAAVWEIFLTLANGGCLCLAPSEALVPGADLAALMARARISHALLPPSSLPLMNADDCPAPRQLVVGGEALDPNRARAWSAQRSLCNAYGPTEVTVAASLAVFAAGDGYETIGRPLPNTRIHILDERLRPVGLGLCGELYIAGEGLARGYLGQAAQTAARFLPNPFAGLGSSPAGDRIYRSGDLARLVQSDEAQPPCIVYLGRRDGQVKIRGFRIELGELESVLSSHAQVAQAVAVALRRPGGDILVAYLTGQVNLPKPEPTELRAWLAQKLPSYMLPSALVVLDAFPKTASNKIDRARLPDPLESKGSAGLPTSSSERELIGIWRDVLGHDAFGVHDNFFEVGGHSLLLTRLREELKTRLNQDLALVELVGHATIAALAGRIDGATLPKSEASPRTTTAARGAVAVIGMAGRFPGAADLETFWTLLCEGRTTIRTFSQAEVLDAGVALDHVQDKRYVRCGGYLDGIELFDAGFFGINAREAELLDPQHRLFLEVAWEAMEHAGYLGETLGEAVGVFAGCGSSSYLLHNLVSGEPDLETSAIYQRTLGNDKDFLATRVSYKLNLKGPSMSVQSACSTSLLAVHLAINSLLVGECTLALAGGVSIRVPQASGYLFQEGMILSPDGCCRPFDSAAQGTVPGNGLGVVVLKRLEAAQADGDFIQAVIRGSAANNDGALKPGFTAPSAQGQAEVIAAALAKAELEPTSISYIEAHGTGTPLGDPVEVSALARVFGAAPVQLGSLKANLGHLDTAAGVAGLIKLILMLRKRQRPPTPHFQSFNPQIEPAGFGVDRELQPWTSSAPLRAGISSFGIGGTNVHMVVEEAPTPIQGQGTAQAEVLMLSARSEAALDKVCARLARHLSAQPDLDLAAVSHTLQVGRKAFSHRRILVCDDRDAAVRQLTDNGAGHAAVVDKIRPQLVMMFPGQGSQFPDMGAELYRNQAVYRECFDQIALVVAERLGHDLRELVYGGRDSSEQLRETEIAQTALFAVSMAAASWWRSIGIQADAYVGHSIGEYVAACLSGVFSLDAALTLVCARARLLQNLPRGAMLAVAAAPERILPLLGPSLSLAAMNGPERCVVSGVASNIDELERTLTGLGLACSRLHTSHAFHSPMMEPMLEAYRACFDGIVLKPATLPFLSNLSGSWAEPEQVCTPEYWLRHLREPVRFGENLACLASSRPVLLEVGPGRTLCQLAGSAFTAIPAMPRPASTSPRSAQLTALGRIWLNDIVPDWRALWAGRAHVRVPLPSYPFERQRYWVEPGRAGGNQPGCYQAYWKPAALGAEDARHTSLEGKILVFSDGAGLTAELVERLSPDRVVLVAAAQIPMLAELIATQSPEQLVFLGSHVPKQAPEILVALVRELARADLELELTVVSVGGLEVQGSETLVPESALLFGPCRVLAQEHPQIRTRLVDLDVATAQALDMLVGELRAPVTAPVVAIRARRRFVRAYEAMRPNEHFPQLPERPVILITGGLGKMGLALASFLAAHRKARLVLCGRSQCPDRSTWEQILAGEVSPRWNARIRQVRALEASGCEVWLRCTDVTDRAAVAGLLDDIHTHFGALHGVIHAAVEEGRGAFEPLAQARSEGYFARFAAKTRGTAVLAELLADHDLLFRVAMSSLAAELGGPGLAAYASANRAQDLLLARYNRTAAQPWLSINWDGWQLEALDPNDFGTSGLAPETAAALFWNLCLQRELGQIVVAQRDPVQHIQTVKRAPAHEDAPKRVPMAAERAAQVACSEAQGFIAGVWKALLGLEEIGPSADFFEHGGDSLTATRVLFRIQERLGVALTMGQFFQNPTIAGLAALIEARPPHEQDALNTGGPHTELILTPAQQRFWFLEQLSDQRTNLLTAGLDLSGPLDLRAFQAAIAALIARHDSLRSVFRESNGQPVFDVLQSVAFQLSFVDLSGLSEPRRLAALDQLDRLEASRRFHLGRAPLLRALVIGCTNQRQRVLLSLHHLVADGWSLNILTRDLSRFYQEQLQAGAAPDARVPGYSDYSRWLQHAADAESEQRELKYWLHRLKSAPTLLELPGDFPRPAQPRNQLVSVDLHFDGELVRALRTRSQAWGTSLFIILQGTLALLLARLTHQSEILIASPWVNRPRRELEDMVGCFLNTLVARIEVGRSATLGEWLQQLKRWQGDDALHGNLPIERILQALGLAHSQRHNPLFQVMLTLNERPVEGLSLLGLTVQPLRRSVLASPLDLILEVEESPAGLAGELKFNLDLFQAKSAERLVLQWLNLLGQVARMNPDTPLFALEPMTVHQRRELHETWNQTSAYLPEPCFPELFRRQVTHAAEQVAAACDGKQVTYLELGQRVERLAARLTRHGVAREKIVALYAERDLEFLIALLAILACGGTYLPLDPAHPLEHQALVLAQARPELVLTRLTMQARAEAAVAKLQPQPPLLYLESDEAPCTRARSQDPIPDQRAYILFTSGSTGLPKGAVLCHRGMLNHLLAKVEDLEMGPTDVLAQNASQSFDISIWQMLAALLIGAKVQIYGNQLAHHPRRLLEHCDRDGITLLELVPSMLQAMLLELEERPGSTPAFARLRWLMLTGEALPPKLCAAWFAHFPEIPIINAYGPTECSDDITHYRIDRPLAAAQAHTPIGTPIRNMQLYVLDRWMRPVPLGVPGELYAAGSGVGRGYLNRPSRSAIAFVPNPFASVAEPGTRLYKTGDLVRLLPDAEGRPGPLSFLGRLDAQVKIRGFRIELGEIETALAAHPAVREAVVSVHEAAEKRLVAHLVCRQAQDPPAELARDLRDYLAGRLPSYMIPSAFVILSAMPLTANGKLDRKALPEPVWAQPPVASEPLSELGHRVATLWRETLGLDRAGHAAHFFEGGGNSLSATRLLSRVQRDYGVELALKTFYAEPTLDALIRHIQQRTSFPTQLWSLFPVRRDQELPLSFAQQRLWFFEHLERERDLYVMPFAVSISGRPDLVRLERAFDLVVERHEILRTAYFDGEQGARQEIRPSSAFGLTLIDASGLAMGDQERAIKAIAAARADHPFDLANGLVLRAAVFRRSAQHHTLLLEIHHIAFDGWSGQILFEQLDLAYHQGHLGPEPPALQYADFAWWQRQWFASGALEPHLRYWTKQLLGAPRLELPFSQIQSNPSENGQICFELDLTRLKAIHAVCKTAQVSSFTLLLAAYQHLLYALTGQTDLVIGTDFANRGRVELEGLIGFFVNMLPLRTRLSAAYCFSDLLDATRRTLLEAEAYQALPYDRLIQALGLERDSGGQPLVRAIFVLDNARADQGSFGNLNWRLDTIVAAQPKFDLSVFVSELATGLRFVFAYRGALFRRESAIRLVDEYRHLLDHVLENPEQPLDHFKTLTRLDKERNFMETESKKAFSLKNLRQTERRPVDLSPQALVTRSFPAGEGRLPLMVRPVRNDVDLMEWAALDRASIQRDLARYGALLFRGFGIADNRAFSQFAATLCSGLYGDYGDLPEEDQELKVYKSTPYPSDKTILFHNESSHMHRWPTRQFFYCAQASEQGGETPLVDCRELYRALDPELARLFREKGLCYVRNFSPGLDVPWQQFFKTESREEVARYCKAAGMTAEWLGPDHLRVYQQALAVLVHPQTGEDCFFNQVQLHHTSCLDEEIRSSLGEVWGEELFPRNVFFGDRSPISDQIMARISELYEQLAVALPWQNGDIIMLDNLLVAHARNPFRGPRKIVVAMGDMMDSPLTPSAARL